MGMILLRYGEIALKGRNRVQFVRRLRRNIRACLKAYNLEGTVQSVGQRIYVYTEQVQDALEPLSRVFGLVSLSPVSEVARDIDAIVEECVRQAREAGVGPGVSYRVRARRADKTFPHTSPEIGRLAGEAIWREVGGEVDLSKEADVTLGVEVRREAAFVYGHVVAAPGGLPVGVEGRVVALISGGIDSPVAAWLMMKRGCGIIPVHFSANESETQKALDNIEALGRYSYGWNLRPTILDHHEAVGPTLEKLRMLGEERWNCIFCKRALLLKACEIASDFQAHAVVMGDSLGQVASQTLPNIEVISYNMPKPILRPLIGFDKTEVVALARRIGTFDISTRSESSCPFLPAHPITRASVEKLIEIARRLDEMELHDA
ncbi:MAG: tRNA 4-thiouridine(8) synthase ThiI [Chloroflexi bacterium RBG_13_56_8]|nr:MAG: tRNA 4-thiouridine(8) synthase ThiI [Chloroflexi bacterium RBG_13_56_8]